MNWNVKSYILRSFRPANVGVISHPLPPIVPTDLRSSTSFLPVNQLNFQAFQL